VSQATTSKRPVRRAKRPAAPGRQAAAGGAPAPVVAVAAPAAEVRPSLPPQLDIRDAHATAGLLQAAVAAGAECIDASRVASVDTAGLQLLLAAGRLAAAHGHALRWEGASSTLIEAATKLGVAGVLGLARVG
jgi:ABC-type transporter Mla MlaB component